jgi:hypothetical protein
MRSPGQHQPDELYSLANDTPYDTVPGPPSPTPRLWGATVERFGVLTANVGLTTTLRDLRPRRWSPMLHISQHEYQRCVLLLRIHSFE